MRQAIQQLQASKIRELANAGLGRSDVLAFWFGESDEVTPDFIRQAAIDSLQAGETFTLGGLTFGVESELPAVRQAEGDSFYASLPRKSAWSSPKKFGNDEESGSD